MKSKRNSGGNGLGCDQLQDYVPGCRFCPEMRGETANSDYHRLVGLAEPTRYIHETSRYVSFPALGELVEGHLLIAPKCHRSAIGLIVNRHALLELQDFVEQASNELEAAYGSRPLIFEHGMVNVSNRVGCCVDHAHLHLMPVQISIRAKLRSLHRETSLDGLADLPACAARGSYLYVYEPGGGHYAYFPYRVPPQYLRRILAAEMGRPQRWDWRQLVESNCVDTVCRTLAHWRNVDSTLRFSAEACSL